MTMPPEELSKNEGVHRGARRKSYPSVVNVDQLHNNTSQEVIHITSDKLKLALMGHLDCLAKKNAWHVPLSLFASAVVVFFTSSFKDFLGVKADQLQVGFFIFAVGCFIWLIKAVYGARKSMSIEELIEIIKNK